VKNLNTFPPANEPATRPAPASKPALARPILHRTVVDHLRQMIVEDQLPPGTRINERVLCEALGMSRTPLREAVKVLAAEGLIDITPNRGASVTEMSLSDIMEAFELMAGLESISGELACQRISDAELNEIQVLHDEMLVCRSQEDLSGYYNRNLKIHHLINQAARNQALRQVYEATDRRLHALRFRSNFDIQKWDIAIIEHEAMLDALKKRAGDRLSAVLKQHLLHKRDVVISELKARRAAPPERTAA